MITDREQEIIESARDIIRPSYCGDVVKWCEDNILDVPDSPIRGRLNLSRTPWVGEALRIATDPETKALHIRACTQSGKSLFLRLYSCWQIVNAPAPFLILQNNDNEARDFFQRYVRKLWDNCPPVKALLSDSDNEKSGVADFKNGVTVYCRGAWNESNLQRISLRTVLMDETWLYPKGHCAEASARTQSFSWMGRIITMSQGGYEGDETSALFDGSDKRQWNFACVSCGFVQPWDWSYVRFPEDAKVDGGWDLRKVEAGTTYECCNCHTRLKDTPGVRAEANRVDRGAGFRATTQSSSWGTVGLHWNCLCNSSWGKESVRLLKAKESYDLYGDTEGRRVWKQKRLALPWSDESGEMTAQAEAGDYAIGDDWDDEAMITPEARIISRSPEAPAGSIPFRTLSVDVQRGHMFCEIRMWAKTGHSRLRHWCKVETWQQLDDLAKEHKIHNSLIGVDCGDQTQMVYAQTAVRGWKSLRGSGQTDFTVSDGPGKTTKRFYSDKQTIFVPGLSGKRAEMIVWGNLPTKDLLSALQKRRMHTYARNVGPDYVAQLTSEIRVKDSRTGKPHWILPSNKACGNHSWDCALMGLILAVRWGIIGRDATDTVAPEDPKAVDSAG
jgi:hypothetical protein